MRDDCPGYAENAWVTRKRAFDEFWQLAIEARRQVVFDFTNLLIDNVKIVEQPFRRRRDRLTAAGSQYDAAIGRNKHICVVVESRRNWPTLAAPRVDALRFGKTLRVLLQALNTEELRANGLLRRARGFLPKEVQARNVQDTQPQL